MVAEIGWVLGWPVPAEIDHSKTRLVQFSDVLTKCQFTFCRFSYSVFLIKFFLVWNAFTGSHGILNTSQSSKYTFAKTCRG
jgi:hypothetical protein